MTLDDDIRSTLEALVRPDGRLVAEPEAPHLLLREGRRRVRRRRVMTASGATAAVASVAVIVTATALVGQSHSGSRPAPTLTKPAQSPLQGEVLGIDRSNRVVLEDLAHPAQRRFLTIPGLRAFTTNPAGGWIAAYAPAEHKESTYVGLIDQAGNFTPTGQLLSESDPVSDLAVSANGSRLAYVTGNVGTAPATRVVVEPTPGHAGSTRTWVVHDQFINQISSLSWAPDGRQLTYVSGTQTGAGIGGTVGSLDTAVPSDAVPVAGLFDDKSCNDAAVAWLGTTDRLTAARECRAPNVPPGPHLVEIDPVSGAGLNVGTSLQGLGCGSTSLSVSTDGSRVLISECGSVSLVTSGRRIPVPGDLIDAAWAGAGIPLPSPVTDIISAACPPASFTLPLLDSSTGVTPTNAATSGRYRNLAPGGSVVVATSAKGGIITLVRGVSNEDFAVSVYSHGSAPLDPLGVLGSATYLYPAEATGADGPRIPFATGNDRVDNACNRWELQAAGVPIPTLIVYGQEIGP